MAVVHSKYGQEISRIAKKKLYFLEQSLDGFMEIIAANDISVSEHARVILI